MPLLLRQTLSRGDEIQIARQTRENESTGGVSRPERHRGVALEPLSCRLMGRAGTAVPFIGRTVHTTD